MRVAFCTLGCKVNQFETQAMETLLARRGYTVVPFEDEADAYVVNTCAVTAESGRKSRQMVRQARKKHPGALVAVCGCYPQTDRSAALELGADLVMGTDGRRTFVDRLEQALSCRSAPVAAVEEAAAHTAFEPLPAGGLAGRTRAMLKAEDGCANFCTYCIIPYARGPVRSLPPEDAAAQAATLAAEGYREIVLTGIEISSWGRDLPGGWELMDLVETVCAAAPGLRVRLSSMEPRTVTEDFCRRAKALPGLCPHFHLSLQSGCDSVLRRMGRRYDTGRYRRSVALLREAFGPQVGLTTDVIVGFPGETEEEFETTLAFLEEMAFSKIHVFPYSIRPGTPAAERADQVPRGEKEARAARAIALAKRLEERFLESLVGETLPVLFESERGGLWQGHAPNYAAVRAEGKQLHNVLHQVRITAAGDGFLTGSIMEKEDFA